MEGLAWPGLSGRPSDWGPANHGQRVSAKDPDTATIAELSRETNQKQSLHLLGFWGSVLP